MAEILFVGKGEHLSLKSAQDDPLPGRHMQRQLPNGVCGRHRAGRCRFSINAVEDLHQSRAVPGFAIEDELQLLNDEVDLRHGGDSSSLALVGQPLPFSTVCTTVEVIST